MVSAVCCATACSDAAAALGFILGDLEGNSLCRSNRLGRVSLLKAGRRISVEILGVVLRRDIKRPADHLRQLLDRDYAWHGLTSLVADGMAGGGVLRRPVMELAVNLTKLTTEGQSAPRLPQTALDGYMLTARPVLLRRSHRAVRVNNLTGEFPQLNLHCEEPVTGSTRQSVTTCLEEWPKFFPFAELA